MCATARKKLTKRPAPVQTAIRISEKKTEMKTENAVLEKPIANPPIKDENKHSVLCQLFDHKKLLTVLEKDSTILRIAYTIEYIIPYMRKKCSFASSRAPAQRHYMPEQALVL